MKTIPGFPNYKITEHGNVWSIPRPKSKGGWLSINKCGKYPQVTLVKNGRNVTKRTHTLVLETYVGVCPEGMEACHLDDDPLNNYINNLKWDTHVNNIVERTKNGKTVRGEQHGRSKLTKKQIKDIRNMYNIYNYSQNELAKFYKVSQTQISRIIRKARWSHI